MTLIPWLKEVFTIRRLTPRQAVRVLVLVLGLSLWSYSWLSASAGILQLYEFSLVRMGTQVRIVLYAHDHATASQAASDAYERIEHLEQIFSDYREDSELMRICRSASQSPRVVSPELFFILDKSLYFSRLSDGAFDVTVGPVVKLWREARRLRQLPEAEQLAKAKLLVGYQNLVLDPAQGTVFLKRDGMDLDLGAIAKGYAADQALAILRNYGIRRALVDAGGDLSLGDPPPGRPGWRIEIQSPELKSGLGPCELFLHNTAVATSGDAYQFLETRGQRFSHIIKPSEALGVRDSVIATVIAPDGTTADAMATTLSVLTPSQGLELANSLEGVSAFLVRRQGNDLHTFASSRFPPFTGGPLQHAGRKPLSYAH